MANSEKLALLRSLLKKEEERKGSSDTTTLPFWGMKEGEQLVVRFLPDKNEDNPFFWVRKEYIRLPFEGKKSNPVERVTITVPCIEMYNEPERRKHVCPILTEVRKMFRDEDTEEIARKYWKKVTYIMQALLVNDSVILDGEKYDNDKIYILRINKQLYQIINAGLFDDEIDEIPTDYENGRDFRIKKTQQGGFASYLQSGWKYNPRPLEDRELKIIEEQGLYDLSSFLPPFPSPEDLHEYYEMFLSSLKGELFDDERWGKYLNGGGSYSESNGNVKKTSSAPKVEPKKSDEDEEEDVLTDLDTLKAKRKSSNVTDEDSPEEEENIDEIITKAKKKTKSGNINIQDLLKKIKTE